jgi:hypothetical protein
MKSSAEEIESFEEQIKELQKETEQIRNLSK